MMAFKNDFYDRELSLYEIEYDLFFVGFLNLVFNYFETS